MIKAPYTPRPKNVKEFFEAIKSLRIPRRVDNAYLPTIGFSSSNDRYLIRICQLLGFIDSAKIPTGRWKNFRDKAKTPKEMTDAIKTYYADLFSTYPDANKRDKETLQNYFASKTRVADIVAERMVKTFKYLCEFADFEAIAVTEAPTKPPTIEKISEVTTGVTPLTININIQLSLPATEDASIYDNLFAALKKHVFS